ncbi:MAG: rRNA maturation RNase YbeY [Hydrogenothermaceae bacterium]|nr:rRNA maturation RNase YbeY [Hydrogenothermaceae bacterium]
MKNRILINKEVYDRDIKKDFLKRIIQEILQELALSNVEISITITDNKRIRDINREWRGKDKPTDVLSFPMEETIGYRYRLLGDVIISAPFAKEQAQSTEYAYKEEVLRLLIHGILHLLGYDHEKSEEDEKEMFELQDRIFNKLKDRL